MFNPADIARHFMMLHRLAAGHNGKLILSAFGDDRTPEVQHFEIGDIVGMTNAALAYAGVPGANLYAPLAVMRAELPPGMKGGESDVVAVLGAVVDSDADKGKSAWPPTTQADYLIETSPGNFQHFLLFDNALTATDAKPLLRALKRATKADCADDASHVWRVAGTANWPNAGKLKRGRPPEPFLVNVKRVWNGSRTKVADLRKAVELYLAPESPRATPTIANVGELDLADAGGVVAFLAERGEFVDYEKWLQAGMALKLAFGDDGLSLWQLTHDGTVTPEVEESKWRSFASEPEPGSTTLLSLIARARERGWRGTVRKTAAAMFPTVTLPAPSNPGPAGGLPMLAGQQALCELTGPIVTDFLNNTADRPSPRTTDYPTLPESMSAHSLYEPLRAAILRVIAMTENGPKLFKHDREAVIEPLAVLQVVHPDTFDTVRRRVASFGCELPDRKIKHAAAALVERIDRTFVSGDWQMDLRGNIEADNPDNVAVFLGIVGCEFRWNCWRERMEIKGGNDPELAWDVWTYVDDTIVAKLRTRAMRTKTRFRPAKEFLWESLLALAHKTPVDPVLDCLTELQAAWDEQPRLDTWLSQTCGVPDDPYHRAVGRNIIGGIVRRARRPGVKHDIAAVFCGPQGTGKSTLAKILAIKPEWFSDSILLGDASKELVLLLAGKLVVEISEMSARNSANANGIKAMVSREVDAGRTAYARAVTERPRRNIFVGTTNDDEPLSDPTGNRRFVPIRCDREINTVWLRANIGQIIGEAATLEAAGDDFAIPREVWSIAAEHADAARSQSDIEIRLGEWLGETPHTAVAYITAADLSEICELAGLRGSNAARSGIMKRMGFRREKVYFGGRQAWVWFRGPVVLPKTIERDAVRYLIGRDGNNRVRIAIRTDAPSLVPSRPMVELPPLPRQSAQTQD